MYVIILGAVLLGGLLVAWGVWKSHGARGPMARAGGGDGIDPDSDLHDLGTAEKPPPNGNGSAPESDAAAIERSKLVIHALLQNVAENVTSLIAQSNRYDSSLEGHRAAIQKAMTIAGIQKLERVMLGELDQVIAANGKYRTQLKEANDRLQAQQEELERLHSDMGQDFLTKIPNRRAFDERLAEELERARRYGHPLSLVVIDVDHFKRVNDVFGHLAGDRILRALAQILDENKRSSDFLARYGGEEFVIILPETPSDRARVLAEKTRLKVQHSVFRYETNAINITISLGVGGLLPDDTTETLFARVDAALYLAKQNGRNRVEAAANGSPGPADPPEPSPGP